MLEPNYIRGDSSPIPRVSWVDAAVLAAAGAILVVFRLHSFGLPLETDECNYAYIGLRLLAGDRLYLDVWDHQPFGVFALFAGVIKLFGDSPVVFRWLATVFSLLSLVLIYAICRRCGGRGAAVPAAVLFAFASCDPGTAGEGSNREIYMNTFILAAWYLALRSGAKPGWMIFASGWALAVGSSVKTIVAVHWVFLAVWIGLEAWRRGRPESRVRRFALSILLFGAGPAVLWLGSALYFAATDRFSEFFDAVFLFNVSYSGGGEGFLARFTGFFSPERHPFIFDSALPLWLGVIGGSAWLLFDALARQSPRAVALLLLTAAGYTAVCLPARFWPHYYYLLIPPLVIVLSTSLAGLVQMIVRSMRTESVLWRNAPVLLLVVFPMWLFATEYRDYLGQPAFGITVKRYNSRDFWGRAQAENVRRVTDPQDRVFVFGNEAEIYYYSKRRCASRYTMITGLQSGYTGYERRRETLMAELEAHKPRVILVLFDEPPFEEWQEFLNRNYGEPIGWDYHDRTGKPIMFVSVLRDRPVDQIDWDWDRAAVGGWHLGDP